MSNKAFSLNKVLANTDVKLHNHVGFEDSGNHFMYTDKNYSMECYSKNIIGIGLRNIVTGVFATDDVSNFLLGLQKPSNVLCIRGIPF